MQHFDLVVVGTGSGNTIVGKEYSGLSMAIIESGPFGGTCLNVGCIPTKMFVYPADLAEAAGRPAARRRRHRRRGRLAGDPGPDLRPDRPDLGERPDVPRGSEMARTSRCCRAPAGSPAKAMTVDLHDGGVGTITADRFVLAAGGRPVIPDIPGLDEESIGRGIVTPPTRSCGSTTCRSGW